MRLLICTIVLLTTACAPLTRSPESDSATVATEREKRITEELTAAGFQITYDFVASPSAEPSPEIAKLIALHGENAIGDPFYIGNGNHLHKLELLRHLPSLRVVDFDKSDASDEDLRYLQSLPNLKIVFLNETLVRGDGFRYLTNSSIEEMHLGYSVGLEAIPHLKRMKHLRRLCIASSELAKHSDEILAHCRTLRSNDDG